MTIVLARDRYGREILWQCAECDKPFNLGWGDLCNACIAQEQRHQEILEAFEQSQQSIVLIDEVSNERN